MTDIRTIGFETFLPCTTLLRVFLDMKYSNANIQSCFRLNYTKLLCLKSIFIVLISSCAQSQSEAPEEGLPVLEKKIVVGAERTNEYVPLIFGDNTHVGVLGNQTSLIGKTHLVDSLLRLGVHIEKVFSPEHGFRGNADAGEHVGNYVDKQSGLSVISLYGKNKKPTKEQLQKIDVILFDIQDVGARFYTYISTLHYMMEACAESNIQLIVLDRPNPNGGYVDGPVLDLKYKSFVGMHPVPIVHGMTMGEYARMINGEGWLGDGKQCDLTVINCENYTHSTYYLELPVPPSPNLRSPSAIELYPSLCLLEATTVSVGRGTDGPFERYGHPDFPETGFSFTPVPGYGSKDPKLNGKKCHGYNLRDTTQHAANHQLNLSYLIRASENLKGTSFVDQENFFNLLAGNDQLLRQIVSGAKEEEIRSSWEPELNQYKKMSQKYLLYE